MQDPTLDVAAAAAGSSHGVQLLAGTRRTAHTPLFDTVVRFVRSRGGGA